jgi:hypothetical protein
VHNCQLRVPKGRTAPIGSSNLQLVLQAPGVIGSAIAAAVARGFVGGVPAVGCNHTQVHTGQGARPHLSHHDAYFKVIWQ